MLPDERLVLEALGRLDGGPTYGLDIAKDAQVRRTLLYVWLARLVERGLVTSEDEKRPTARRAPRKLYSLTDAGRAQLAEWSRWGAQGTRGTGMCR